MRVLGFTLRKRIVIKFSAVAKDGASVEIYVLHQKKVISTLDGDVSFNARSKICLASGQKVVRRAQGMYEIDGNIFVSDDPQAS